MLRVLGFGGMRLFSYPVALLFLLMDARSRRETLRYWRRVRPGDDGCTQLARAWRQMACFGRLLCDRMLAYSRPGRMRLAAQGHERLRVSLTSGTGRIILSAHLGNWALAGRILSRWDGPPVNVVKVELESDEERAIYERIMGDRAPKVIDPRDPLGATLAIREALSRGETVGMLGDRVYGDQPCARVPFLGPDARFPIGPFQIAAATGAPIFVCFCLRRGDGAYRFIVDEPWYVSLPSDRRERPAAMRAAAARWAKRLETEVRRRPLQWHNFHDFWA